MRGGKKRKATGGERADMAQTHTHESLLSRVSRYTDVSLCAFTDFRIEIERLGTGAGTGCGAEKCVTAYGVFGIRTMKAHVVALDYRTEYFVIRGECLVCHAYADGAMCVRGRIGSASFCRKEEYRDEDH